MSTKILELKDVTVSFDGFKAIDGLTFSVNKGEIRMVIGPNGAGKSTMCDTIIGKVQPVAGSIEYKGKNILGIPEHKIVGMGICRKFQTPGVLENLSIEDNLAVAVRTNKNWFSNFHNKLDFDEADRLEQILQLVGLEERRKMLAGQIAHGEKQWLEIGMVVASEAELLLLDEPTAGMTAQETAKTAELIKSLAGAHTILVIDHDMHFVELLGAPVSVLHQGKLFKEGSIADLRNDPEVIQIYLGRAKEEKANV